MLLGVVSCEQVLTPVVGEIPPDRVNVGSIVLGVVVLDHEGRAFNGVIVALLHFLASQPGEGDRLQASLLDPSPLVLGNLVGGASNVEANQANQSVALLA